ncbi:hypothetical protein PGTUg99_006765, partial [Puccinia graminis f. sp. tritici]
MPNSENQTMYILFFSVLNQPASHPATASPINPTSSPPLSSLQPLLSILNSSHSRSHNHQKPHLSLERIAFAFSLIDQSIHQKQSLAPPPASTNCV